MNIRSAAPHHEKLPFPILRPRFDQPLKLACMSRRIFGLDTHWGNDATYHCVGPENCKACRAGKVPRYQGYILGRSLTNETIAVIHLTASAASVIEQLDTGSRGLVGLKMILTRKNESSNAEVIVHTIGWENDLPEIPAEKLSDLIHAIYRVNRIGSAAYKMKA